MADETTIKAFDSAGFPSVCWGACFINRCVDVELRQYLIASQLWTVCRQETTYAHHKHIHGALYLQIILRICTADIGLAGVACGRLTERGTRFD